MGARKTGLSPQVFYTVRSEAVLLLWFLTVTCSWCPYLYFGSAIMLVTYFVNFRYLNDHLFGKELFIQFTTSAFRKLPSINVFSYFPFGFEGRMWDLIILVPDHCLTFYFTCMVDFATYSPLPQCFSIFGNILHTNPDRVGKPETTYTFIFLPNLNHKYPKTPAFKLNQYPMSQKCS